MSKRRILRLSFATIALIVVGVGLYRGIDGVVTLIEENNELQVENTKIHLNNIQLEQQVENLESTIERNNGDIQFLKKKVEEHNKAYQELKDTNDKLKGELKKEKERVSTLSMPSRGQQVNGTSFYVEATAYTALCYEGCTGITATGINLLKNRSAKVIAVDPNVIPLGSKVYVEGYGHAIAGDTGGAIKGYKIDIHVPTERIANQWGRKKVKITILK